MGQAEGAFLAHFRRRYTSFPPKKATLLWALTGFAQAEHRDVVWLADDAIFPRLDSKHRQIKVMLGLVGRAGRAVRHPHDRGIGTYRALPFETSCEVRLTLFKAAFLASACFWPIGRAALAIPVGQCDWCAQLESTPCFRGDVSCVGC